MIAFVIIASGMMFALRMCELNKQMQVIDTKVVTIIGTIMLMIIIAFIHFGERNALTLFLIVWVPSISLAICIHFSEFLLLERQRRDLYEGINQLILLMKSGHGFRRALQSVMQEGPRSLRRFMSAAHEVVSFSQQESALLVKVRKNIWLERASRVFIEVDRAQHRAIQKLEAFRRYLKMEIDLRRRSRQVTAQLRAQATLMSLFYLLLFLFTMKRYGFHKHARLFCLSIALYILGVLVMFFIGRKRKWKV